MGIDSLTQREGEVVRELLRGKTDREIAEALGITKPTVKNHLRIVRIKWGCLNRTQVALRAAEIRTASEQAGRPTHSGSRIRHSRREEKDEQAS